MGTHCYRNTRFLILISVVVTFESALKEKSALSFKERGHCRQRKLGICEMHKRAKHTETVRLELRKKGKDKHR